MSSNSRKIAYEIFRDVIREGAYSNLLLPKRLSESDLDRRDRAFVTELVYGAIRQIGRNDYIAGLYSSKPWAKVDPEVVDIIRLGAYQIFDMRVPAHAAVNEMVSLARKMIGKSQSTFVNAILRRMSERDLNEHLKGVDSLAIRYSHPQWIVDSYLELLPESEVVQLLEANNRPVAPTLVAWPGQSTVAELTELGATPTPFSPYGVSYLGAPMELGPIRERRAGVQDEGSQLVTEIFAKAAPEPWLDLCAGPGGKAALLSYLAKGTFYANEISATRTRLISQVVKQGTILTTEDGRTMTANVNSVLADVPCTGIGALRRRPEIRWRRTLDDLNNLITLQRELINHAITILPNDGVLAYVTCSPHKSETLAQIDYITEKSMVQLDVAEFLPPNLGLATSGKSLQLWPHRHNTDAMFMAIFRKTR